VRVRVCEREREKPKGFSEKERRHFNPSLNGGFIDLSGHQRLPAWSCTERHIKMSKQCWGVENETRQALSTSYERKGKNAKMAFLCF